VRFRRPPCHSPNPREQLAEPERLGEIVVGAHLEPDDLVDLLALGGDHDDGHGRPGTQLAAHRQAVHVGQADVEQDEVGLASRQRRAPGGRALDVESFPPEPFGERLGDRVLVFDEQHLHIHMVPPWAIPDIRRKPQTGCGLFSLRRTERVRGPVHRAHAPSQAQRT
jgi:hypothetical protein